MRFRTFEWPQAPSSLEITHRRPVRETQPADGRFLTQDAGVLRCVIEGEGQFVGADAMRQFEALQAAVEEEGAGVLCLPGMRPFRAVAKQLVLRGRAHPHAVQYSFVFMEAEELPDVPAPPFAVAAEGDTLWDFAFRFSRSMEEMIGANPQIPKILRLHAGERVVIP